VLGTPSIRFNDFVSELSYLEELENKFGLTYGIKANNPEKLLQKITELLAFPDLKGKWSEKRKRMLNERGDLTKIMFNLLVNDESQIFKK
ncbi:MAG: hypothetical protein ABI763_07880, partial [Bacteroidota bacterium]